MRTVIWIPTLDEAENIGPVLGEILALPGSDVWSVLVLDDRSEV